MNNLDPDIIHALRVLAADGATDRVKKIKAKHDKQDAERFETQMQLFVDEVERVIPRTHPLFDLVLIIAVARKVERSKREPEFTSYLDEGFPSGW